MLLLMARGRIPRRQPVVEQRRREAVVQIYDQLTVAFTAMCNCSFPS